MHIIIDIDNTILDGTTTHLKYCNIVTGRNIQKEEVTQFYIYHYYDWTLQDFEEVYDQYGEKMHEESTPLPYAIENINKLKQEHRITFMTARPEKYRLVTEQWLSRYGVRFDSLVMTEGKLESFIAMKGDLLIDDSPHYAQQFKTNNLRMILMDYPYNKDIEGSTIYRATNWFQVETIINNKFLYKNLA